MAKTFHATLTATVNPGQRIAAATNFSTNISNHVATFGMTIVPFAETSSSTEDYFVPSIDIQSLDTKAMDHKCLCYSAAIVLKIVPNIKCPQLQHTSMNQIFASNHQVQFNMLKTLMEMHTLRIQKPHTPSAYVEQTAWPTFKLRSNPYTFQTSDLQLYYQNEETSYGRTYLQEMEKTNMFLGNIKPDTRYSKATPNVRNGLPRDINAEVPMQYRLDHIADTICCHLLVDKGNGLDVFNEEAPQPHHIRSTEAPYDDTEATILSEWERQWRNNARYRGALAYNVQHV